MQKNIETIHFSLDEIIKIVKEIDAIMISFAAQGSFYDQLEDLEKETNRFISDSFITYRLSKIRSIIYGKFHDTLSEEDMDDLINELEQITYWEKTGDNLKPIAFSNAIFLSFTDSPIDQIYQILHDNNILFLKSNSIEEEKVKYFKNDWLEHYIEIKEEQLIKSMYNGYLTKKNTAILNGFLESIHQIFTHTSVKKIRLIVTELVDLECYDNIMYKEVSIKALNNLLFSLPEIRYSSAIIDIIK